MQETGWNAWNIHLGTPLNCLSARSVWEIVKVQIVKSLSGSPQQASAPLHLHPSEFGPLHFRKPHGFECVDEFFRFTFTKPFKKITKPGKPLPNVGRPCGSQTSRVHCIWASATGVVVELAHDCKQQRHHSTTPPKCRALWDSGLIISCIEMEYNFRKLSNLQTNEPCQLKQNKCKSWKPSCSSCGEFHLCPWLPLLTQFAVFMYHKLWSLTPNLILQNGLSCKSKASQSSQVIAISNSMSCHWAFIYQQVGKLSGLVSAGGGCTENAKCLWIHSGCNSSGCSYSQQQWYQGPGLG